MGSGDKVVRAEEAERRFRALKAGLESGAISEEEFELEIRRFLFQDGLGGYWTIGAQTEAWYRYEDGEWVRAAPPLSLERLEDEVETPQEGPHEVASAPRRLPPTPSLIALASVLFVVCLLAVAVASYQYGRMSAMVTLPTRTPTEIVGDTPSPSAHPARGLVTSGTETPAVDMTAPTPTLEQSAPATVPRPSSTPTGTPTANATWVQELTHAAPVLVEPEDGVERGPTYYAILIWKPVENLRDNEYYHVEVCWNDCTVHWGAYVRDASWTFPDFLRGESVDAAYYWHVTVRRQAGDAPAGPADPATSPTSDTWKFLLAEA